MSRALKASITFSASDGSVGGNKTIAGTSYTLKQKDDGRALLFTSDSAVTLTVPSGLNEEFGCVIIQLGEGDVTPTDDDVSISNRQGHTKTAGQYAAMSLIAVAVDTFILIGDGA